MSPADLVMADLVDALIQERLLGFEDATPCASAARDGWYCVPIGDGDGVVRVRLRECAGLQRYRFAGGPVLHRSQELAAHELLRLITGAESPAAQRVCDDVRTAVEHARVTLAARHDLTPRPGDLLAGERLAATRGRPFHPTARAAAGWTAGELAEYGPMRREPLGLAWVAVRAECLRFGAGAGADRLADLLLDATDRDRLDTASAALGGGFCLLPVHPWQLDHVLPRAFADELDAGLVRPVARAIGRFHPTASLRTLSSPLRERHVKLPLGIATLGAARLLPPRHLDNGERAERLMRGLLQRDPLLRRRVSLCDEQTWCGWAGDEFGDRPGQLAAQLRSYPARVLDEPGTLAVAMAALAAHEWGTLGPAIDADLDPVAFFGALAAAFAEVGLGFLRYGVLPELHGQNVVVTLRDGLPERFVLRDHDTLRLHPAWLDAAGVPDPGYRIKPGAPQSLQLDRPQTLVGYLQTLGFQVNLYAIADALGRHYGIDEAVFWEQLRRALAGRLDELELPEHVEVVVRRQLLGAPAWPARQVLGPLLAQGSSTGVSMPAATGEVRNPLLPPVDAGEVARRAGRRRLLNAFVREAGVHDVQAGPLRIPLTATGSTLIVDVRHRSAFGHHDYGDAPVLERAGGRRAPLEHDAFVDALLTELAAVAGVTGADAPRRKAELATQIANSIARTARYVRRGRPPAPSGDAHALTRHAEQSLLFGHPFHPTPKSSEGFDEADLVRYAPELGAAFVLHHFAVARHLVVERRVAPGAWLPEELAAAAPAGYALLPAHPWQARYLLALPAFAALVAAGDVVHLGPRGPQVYATSSVRTVCAPGFETAWKLALHVRITNYVRTNPVEHVRRATDAGALVSALAGRWPHDGFGVLLETGFRMLDPSVVGDELAADVAVLFRQHPFAATGAAPRVLAGLLEEGFDGEPPELVRCVREAGDVAEWLRRFLDISLRPLLTLFARDGLSLEAHVQNSLLCTEDGWPTRFWVRDMEGASASRQRLARNGMLDALPADSPALYEDAEAWLRLRYHAVTNQLGHVVSVLGRHTDAGEERLWAVAREAVAGWRDAEPYASELLDAPALPAKANLSSRFAGRSERPLYVDVANPMRELWCMTAELVQRALTAPTFALVRRRLLRQLLEALLFEGALRVRTSDTGDAIVDGVDERGEPVRYVFAARRRHGFDRIAVGPGPVRRLSADEDHEAGSVSRFLGEVRDALQADPEHLARFAHELEETLVKDALAQHVREQRADVLAGAGYDALEGTIMDGHRYHPTYKSRLGFDLADNLAYGPEFAAPVRPLWLAARRSISEVTLSRAVSEAPFVRGQLGDRTLAQFEATIRAWGEDPALFTLVPVHPWQWREKVARAFAEQLARRDLIVLGDDPEAFVAQQSIRTLACAGAPQRPYLKLALSIVNTSTSRVLAPHTVRNAPLVSDWLARVVGADAFLRDELRTVLLGEVMGSAVNPPAAADLARADGYGTLACIWRESLRPRLDPGEQAVPFNGLTARERDGTPLIDGWVRALGVAPWLVRVVDVSAIPLLHLLWRHGIALEAHAQNVVLLHRDGVPTRVALKDFHDGVRFSRAQLGEPELCPDLAPPPAYHENRNSFLETDDLSLVADFLLDAFFFINLGELAIFLADAYDLDEHDFWAIVGERIAAYERRFPELADRFTLFDARKPTIAVEKLATRRLLPDTELRLHAVRNPLAGVPRR